MNKKRKKKNNLTAEALKVAREKGLSITSTGVNAAAIVTQSSVSANLARVAGSIRYTPPASDATEAEWSGLVWAFAIDHGWEGYHTRDSRGSEEGFPDWVFAKIWPNNVWSKLFYAELKRQDGVQTEAQKKWERLVRMTGGTYYLWRPSDWELVQRILTEAM